MEASEFIRVFGLDVSRMAVNECTPECDLDTLLEQLTKQSNSVEV